MQKWLHNFFIGDNLFQRNFSIDFSIQECKTFAMTSTEFKVQKEMMKQLDAIIDSSYDGLWICDHEGKVVRINKASEKINGIKADQVLGKKMEDLIREGLIDRSVTLEVLKNRTTVTIIQQLKNGKQLLVTGNPVLDDREEIFLVVVNERDITELNRLRNELEENRALAQGYRFEISQLQKPKGLLSMTLMRSESMHRVLNTAMKVAQVDSIVMIRGESGVGKGHISKLIHQTSPRKDSPFIRVDCGAIPESLIESELFGYEEGAFTGARAKGKPGLFELAEGGTLFLDEVGEIPLSLQVKLLRFLEENEVIRVGGSIAKRISARVISATHRNLEDMVKKREFREDLFFRMNVVPIRIPPLRERVEDIPPLIHFFLKQFNNRCSAKKAILPRVVDCLCRYPFPGNIRELANLVEQLVVLTPSDFIDLENLPSHVRMEDSKMDYHLRRNGWNLPKVVEKTEREMIIRALKTFKSQRKAAGPLGIDQSTLARKVKRYGIRSDSIMHYDD